MMNTSPDNKSANIGCVIMASGLGQRFGGNKLMADFGGKPMVSWIIDAATCCFEKVVVVTRNSGVKDLCGERGINVIFHEFPYRSDTIRLGVERLSNDVDGIVFCLADQPFLSVITLRKIIKAASYNPKKIWRSCSGETLGSPTYFPKEFFDELCSLPQDKGGSYVCKKYSESVEILKIDNSLELKDIDTRDTYEKLLPFGVSLSLWSDYLTSGKNHLLITGWRGSGKTTLVNSLIPLIGDSSYGLTSYAVKGVDVRLINNKTSEEVIIGRFNPDEKDHEHKMMPLTSVFDTKGTEFVDGLIDSVSDFVVIDEIGYLETTSKRYLERLRKLFDSKRVIAVVRKDNMDFLTEILSRPDSYVVNTEYLKSCK